nr:copia protein [Tanacetum cinerariifolium]
MVEENRVFRTKKYDELSTAKKIQADCDMKATNIILQGDDLIACLNKAMAFLTVEKAMLAEAQEARQMLDEEQLVFLADLGIPASQAHIIIPHNAPFQTEDLDTYDYDCDDLLSTQAVLMANISNYGSEDISEPQSFYDNVYKQALGYQNPFYLKKAQRIKLALYDGIVIYEKHVAMPMNDDETLIFKEKSRSKMSEKEKDPEAIKQNISHKLIDYEKLNRLTEDFGKRFTPQQELSVEQDFWLRISNPTIKSSSTPSVKVDVPSELPKVSLVNESLKKLKFQLAQFDSVVKKRTTPNALTEGESGFEHTKVVFNNEIIPFLKSLKNIFNVFDKDLLNEITKVQTVFDQMEAVVQQSLVDKQCLEIANKELLLENDRLSIQIMSQDIVSTNTLAEYMILFGADNRPLMLDKDVYDSWKSRMELYMKNREHGRMILESVEHGPLTWPTVEENGVIRTKKYAELSCNAPLRKEDDTIKSLRKNNKEEIVDHDRCDLATTNEELENSVANLLFENKRPCKEINRVKQVFKDQIDSIKQTRVLQKEQRKATVDNATQIPYATTVAPGMFKLDLEPLAPNNAAVKDSVNDVKSGCLCAIYGRTFTIFGKSCPLTRITSTNVVPLKQTPSHSVEIKKPEIKVYNRKLKNVKNVGLSKMAKIVESKNANHLEPNHTWGSILTDIPSSSSLVMTGCLDCTLTLREFYDNVGISHQTSVARTPQQNGKFDAKADIGIFVGYAPAKKAFRIYNRRTRIIIETIHVTFDELTAMASEQSSSGPGLHSMTPATSRFDEVLWLLLVGADSWNALAKRISATFIALVGSLMSSREVIGGFMKF